MPKLEVGRIINLEPSKAEQELEEQKGKQPIGFISPDRKSGERRKLDKVGFNPVFEAKESENPPKQEQ